MSTTSLHPPAAGSLPADAAVAMAVEHGASPLFGTSSPSAPEAAESAPPWTGSDGTTTLRTTVQQVHELLDRASRAALGPVSGTDVAAVDRAISRLEALKLRLVAAAEAQHAAEGEGATGTAAWLATHTRTWGARAAGDVSLAVALDESLPATREALAQGALSTAHAGVIAAAAGRLPAGLTADERTRIEASLVAQARRLDPVRLRRAARRALEAAERSAAEIDQHEDAELRDEESRARSRVRLTLHDNRDGTVTGHFTVPTLAGEILRKVVQQMVAPRRRAVGHEGDATAAGPGSVDWPHRYGEAFTALLERLPTDRLHGKVAATVVVTVSHDALRRNLGAARVDTGHDLSAGEVRRLACGAAILPAVLDGASLPLDLGRSRRFYSDTQRVALATRYDECSVDGCDRPYAWCELHHEEPWAGGGSTDLDRAVPVCRFHHVRVHDRRFATTITTGTDGRKVVMVRRRC